jgi:hypothetical protein
MGRRESKRSVDKVQKYINNRGVNTVRPPAARAPAAGGRGGDGAVRPWGRGAVGRGGAGSSGADGSSKLVDGPADQPPLPPDPRQAKLEAGFGWTWTGVLIFCCAITAAVPPPFPPRPPPITR